MQRNETERRGQEGGNGGWREGPNRNEIENLKKLKERNESQLDSPLMKAKKKKNFFQVFCVY